MDHHARLSCALLSLLAFSPAMAKTAQRSTLPAPKVQPGDLAGNWNVSLTVNHSSCSDTNVGDVISMQWIVSSSQGELEVKSISVRGDGTYTGTIDKEGKILLSSYHKNKDDRRRVDVDLKWEQGQMIGRRVLTRADGLCTIISDVIAKKI